MLKKALVLTAMMIPSLSFALLAQQERESRKPIVDSSNWGSVLSTGALITFAEFVPINRDSVRCVPCDRFSVPGFDRWVIAPTRSPASQASNLLRVGMVGLAWLDLWDEGRAGRRGIVASIESIFWAEAVTHLTKTLMGRYRPVLYTRSGSEVATVISNQRSFPSGHATTAAALATSYWITRMQLSGESKPDWSMWAIAAGAVGVGVLRVAAAKHYPSDVLAGWAVGVGTTLAVHSIRF